MSKNRPPRQATLGRHVLCFGIITLLGLGAIIPALPAAADDAVTWTRVAIPTQGEAGGWGLADGSDIRHLTTAPDGTLYAACAGLTYTLYRSVDNGSSWQHIGGVQDDIAGIAVSPGDNGNIYYATASDVYRSSDGGKTFAWLPPNPGGAGSGNIVITSLAVAWGGSDVIAVGTRDGDAGQYGGVYTLEAANAYSLWTDTGVGDYDVGAVAFSPGYNYDRQLTAVLTDETDTFVASKVGNAGWGDHIGPARLDRDNSGMPTPVAADSPAAVAFPGGYDPVTPGGIRHFFVGITTGTGTGDVYKIYVNNAPAASLAIDLNIGQLYGQANVDIRGLAAGGGNPATVLAGASGSAQVYLSSDGGTSWTMSQREPTGGSATVALMPPDFAVSGRIYAATSGDGSALSVSRDGGGTWNQLGLIDGAISTIVDLAPSPAYEQDTTLFMVTFGGGNSSLWRSRDGGSTWERILSSHLSEVDTLTLVGLPPQYGAGVATVFAAGESDGSPTLWQSEDDGQCFRRRLTHDPVSGTAFSIDTWAIASDSVLFVASHQTVYRTDNGGFFYDTATEAGGQPLNSLALSPGYPQDGTILTGNSDGWVYYSTDNGESFQCLPGDAAAAPLTDHISVAFDTGFAANATVYAASDSADGGVARFVIGASTDWVAIDGTLPAGAELNRLQVSPTGTLYAANSDSGGGLERCLNPSFPLGPTFETVTRGLADNATLTGLWQAGRRLWSVDTTNLRLMTFNDTLTDPVVAVSPGDGTTGGGTLTDHTIRNVVLDWETLPGATAYQWQCTAGTSFASIPDGLQETTAASSARLPALEPDTTYRWRVRASSPVLSPWSATQTFITTLDTEPIALRPESPPAGASGVAVKPVFQWTAIAGATAYELLVAAAMDFLHPAIVKTGEYALPSNAWQCDVGLEYATTYYWKVRAINNNSLSIWSAVGAFTTAPPPETTAPPEETPAPEFPPTADALSLRSPAVDGLILTATPSSASTPAPSALPPPAQDDTSLPDPGNSFIISGWAIYLVGGLLFIITLALLVILAMALKIRRI